MANKWLKYLGNRIWSVLNLHKTLPLLWNLFLDKEVSTLRKSILILLGLGYMILPTDVILDWIPFFGQLDDITVWIFLIDRFLEGIPIHIRNRYLK